MSTKWNAPFLDEEHFWTCRKLFSCLKTRLCWNDLLSICTTYYPQMHWKIIRGSFNVLTTFYVTSIYVNKAMSLSFWIIQAVTLSSSLLNLFYIVTASELMRVSRFGCKNWFFVTKFKITDDDIKRWHRWRHATSVVAAIYQRSMLLKLISFTLLF